MSRNHDNWLKWLRWGLIGLTPVVLVDYSITQFLDPIWLYSACGLIAGLGLAVGVKLLRPSRRAGWYLLSIGIFTFVAGDVIYFSQSGVPPYPGLADAFYLAGYPFLALGLARLTRFKSANRANLIDALILSTSAALVTWVYLMKPYAIDSTLSLAARLVSMAYPIADLLLLVVVCLFFISVRKRSPSFVWMGVSIFSMLVSDVIVGMAQLNGTYTGGWQDLGYLISYVALVLAALHPSMRDVGADEKVSSPRLSFVRIGLLAVSALIGPGLLLMLSGRPTTTTTDLQVTAVGSLVLFLLALLRIGGLTRAIDRNSLQVNSQKHVLSDLVAKLQMLEKERGQLHDAVLVAAEIERSALAVDLHDGPIQKLTGIGFDLELALIGLENSKVSDSAATLRAAVDGLSDQIASLRELMSDLRPPVLDERGLAAALTDLVAEFQSNSGVGCSVDIETVDVRHDLETLLYRVAQETIVNVRKHAKAQNMSLSLTTPDDGLKLTVTDDGDGIDGYDLAEATRSGHIGLASIVERVEIAGGTCDITSESGAGTSVSVAFTHESLGEVEVVAPAAN